MHDRSENRRAANHFRPLCFSGELISIQIYQAAIELIACLGFLCLALSAAAQSIQPIYSFTVHSPAQPKSSVTVGPDGNIYGTTSEGGSAGLGTVFQMTTNGTVTVLANFTGTNGANPNALVPGPDGNFYGTTSGGGSINYGTVFRITTNGTLTTLSSFSSNNGAYPAAGLTLGPDGNFYGTTFFLSMARADQGGGSGAGTVFRITTNGILTTLASFATNNGAGPLGLTLGSDGNFYGTTERGGTTAVSASSGYGTVFRITTDGALTTLFSFGNTNGASPLAGLTQGPDGNFYGTTGFGAANGPARGTAFRITTNGVLTTLFSFSFFKYGSGEVPEGTLALGPDGNFYGTTVNGGSIGRGTVFRITTNGIQTTVANFANTNGQSYAGLTLGPNGRFYGTTSYGGSVGLGTVFQITTGGALTTLASFGNDNAANSAAALALGPDGNFYGTTALGGTGAGTVFQISTNGALTILSRFSSTNGAGPEAGLTLGPDGKFYGTTAYGGSAGVGTVFQITTNGSLTTLANITNGAYPDAALVLGPDNNFYGTTEGGDGYGTVFRITTNGTLTTLAGFTGTNGEYCYAPLALGPDSNFYGTTLEDDYGVLSGTVFQITTNGALTTIHAFSGSDGAYPVAGLAEGPDGNLYGTTLDGGIGGVGTVFRITTNGMLTTLANFATSNGATPYAGLTLGPDGNFYGTTSAGGSDTNGTVFEITTSGMLSMLASFTYNNGSNPRAGLTLGPDNNFYGTTYSGGGGGGGVIYRLNLPPSIVTEPSNQIVLAGSDATFSVTIFGTAPFGFQWLSNATPIAGATNSTLTIPDTMPSATGDYQVIVTNAWGGVASIVAALSVIPVPPMITNQPVSEKVPIGGTATFAVGATGTPPLAYQWYFNGHTPSPPGQQSHAQNGTRRQEPLPGATNATLSFGSVRPNHDGDYQVIVSSPYGSATSDQASLTVLLRPNFNAISNSGAGLMTLLLTGAPNSTNRLWTTTNLALPLDQWQPISTNTADATGLFEFTDTNLGNSPARYYILSSP